MGYNISASFTVEATALNEPAIRSDSHSMDTVEAEPLQTVRVIGSLKRGSGLSPKPALVLRVLRAVDER